MEGNIYDKLRKIQCELKAPKSQYNSFGNYKYRKAEDILEAVKPLLDKYGCTLICSDKLVQIGDRYYIQATAQLIDCESEDSAECNAFAREEESKKGMDGSQVTGASSSYARKYALNGLLCIDDTADSDTTNVGSSEEKPKKRATKKEDRKDEESLVLSGDKPAEGPGIAETEAEAVAMAKNAKDADELTAIWNMNKSLWGQSNAFIIAISQNPNNPKKRG